MTRRGKHRLEITDGHFPLGAAAVVTTVNDLPAGVEQCHVAPGGGGRGHDGNGSALQCGQQYHCAKQRDPRHHTPSLGTERCDVGHSPSVGEHHHRGGEVTSQCDSGYRQDATCDKHAASEASAKTADRF